MLTAEQKEARLSGLGGSDAGAVLGMSPYRTPFDVWLEKTGRSVPENIDDKPAVHFGNVLEGVVADEFSRRTGLKVRRQNLMQSCARQPYLLANVDRMVVGRVAIHCADEADGVALKKAGLECKTAGPFMADSYGAQNFALDEYGAFSITGPAVVPAHYEAQCRHYMHVLDADVWFLAVLIGGQDFRMFAIERDAGIEAEYREKMRSFWEIYVESDVPPPAAKAEDVTALYPEDDGVEVPAVSDDLEMVSNLRDLRAMAKEVDGQIKDLELALKNRMGAASALVDASGRALVTWKASKPSMRFSATMLKEKYPEIYDECRAESPGTRRFIIK